jgi:hypothetical protein
VVVIVSVVILAAVVLVAAWLARPRHDSVVEHQRALQTLREIAERPREAPERSAPDGRYPTDHVQLLAAPPDSGKRRARPPARSARAKPSRRARTDYSSRPTIAYLPTIGPALRAVDGAERERVLTTEQGGGENGT